MPQLFQACYKVTCLPLQAIIVLHSSHFYLYSKKKRLKIENYTLANSMTEQKYEEYICSLYF